jgi:hypothetical protein
LELFSRSDFNIKAAYIPIDWVNIPAEQAEQVEEPVPGAFFRVTATL